MGDKIIDQATKYIDALAAKLGVASEYVFEILVRQQIASGIVTIIGFCVVLAVLIVILYHAHKRADYDEDNGAMGVMIIGSVIFTILFISGFFGVGISIQKLINPEYYAIREIIDVFSGK